MLKRELLEKLTEFAKNCLKNSSLVATRSNSTYVEPIHILEAIFREKGSLGSNILANMGIKLQHFPLPSKENFSGFKKQRGYLDSPDFSEESKKAVVKSFSLANSLQSPFVGTEHMAYALMELGDEKINKIIKLAKSSRNNLSAEKSFSSYFKGDENMLMNLPKILNLPDLNMAKNKKSKKTLTPYLDQFCLNLNREVEKTKEKIVGRDKEIERIANILCRKTKNSPVLVGDPGVGKTAIVSGLAERINAGNINPSLLEKEIRMLDMASVVAGTSFRGEFEARLKKIIEESSHHKNIILFIDELHGIVGAGNASGGLDAANILKPALSRGIIQCIGATTISEYKKYIEKDPALERRFQPVKISEPNIIDSKKIISGIKEHYEKFHNVILIEGAIDSSVELSARYLPDRRLPDKAIDLIDEAASWVRGKNKASDFKFEIKNTRLELEKIIEEKNNLVNEEKYEEAGLIRQKEMELAGKLKELEKKQALLESEKPITVTGFDVASIVSNMTGIPAEKINSQNSAKMKVISKKLNKKIIGQEKAVGEIVSAMYRSMSGVASPDRPMGSFLFLGPTGVGKTYTAKMLAQELFESENSLIRIDMSEFMERHSVSQLIGAPAGYIGFGEGGKLTEKIRRQPYSVVLFDEIEKAHPDVFNLFFQILEEGILTDAEGRTVSFKNSIIILTSNIGTQRFTETAAIGFSSRTEKKHLAEQFENIRAKTLEDLASQLRPELINRLDSVLVFRPLGLSELKKICRLELENLEKRLLKRNIRIKISPRAIDAIAKSSLNAREGARLVRKNIQTRIEDKIAEMIIKKGASHVKILKIDAKKGVIYISAINEP
jgi:ATP-dependent Clp protease ATP-binding subunit ClpC